MPLLQDALSSAFDLLLVVLGFSAIIIIHEAGHFFAARWAGIRVLAFAVGFGPAIVSYRKGLGFRRGSSEGEYNTLVKDAQGFAGAARENVRDALTGKVSPTEYRLNILPFGGYVKMLGQDDADPGAISNEPDSFQNCPVWKRMIVISAGVVFNIITAAVLFVIVFNPYVGLKTEPAKVGAITEADRPAAVAIATNAAELGVTEPGLQPGDTILSVNGDRPSHFNDFSLEVAMAPKGEPLRIDVQRPNVRGVLHFVMKPEIDSGTRMYSIGALPMTTDRLVNSRSPRVRSQMVKMYEELGFPGLEPGMRLVAVNGIKATSPYTIDSIIDRSDGSPATVTFEKDASGADPAKTINVKVTPRQKFGFVRIPLSDKPGDSTRARHLLGLTPVLAIDKFTDKSRAQAAGLKEGDIFARIGSTDWPSVPAGMLAIRSQAGKEVDVVVARKDASGQWREQPAMKVPVDGDGRIGFVPTDSASVTNVLAAWPGKLVGSSDSTPSGGSLAALAPGSRITAINAQPASSLGEVRDALKKIVAADPKAAITLAVQTPGGAASTEISWQIRPDEATSLARLGWDNPLDSNFFEPERFVWKSESFSGAIPMGLHETHRVMMNTYATFARLFQGTVKVEHLKGPVGIAHLGVAIADKGFVWLLFFMALISVNLAVINFLPMPIADGGHMVFLIYEQFTGRPPSVRFQNAAAICGLAILGALFLIVTFQDVTNVFRSLSQFFKG